MADLIKIENGNLILDIETSNKIAEFERQLKVIKEQEENLKEAIKAEMEAKGILKIEADGISITYVAPTQRETFDTKAFKKDNPEMYDDYVNFSPVKSSIRIKVK